MATPIDIPTTLSGSAEGPVPHRRAWQAIFVVLALIPLSSSILALAVGTERFVDGADVNVTLDSTYRYLGGVYLALALVVFWAVPRIEARVNALVFVAGAIFLGGIGRLLSIAAQGAPGAYIWLVLVIELGVLPLALFLRRRVTTSS